MESINELRELTKEWRRKSITPGRNPAADKVDCIADAIEAEVAERYMELPLDADGVCIRVGDEMERISGFKYGKVAGVGVGVFFTNHYMNDYHKQFAADCRHVEPRTLEDVLQDAFIECDENFDINRTEVIARYAAEIRELLGVE